MSLARGWSHFACARGACDGGTRRGKRTTRLLDSVAQLKSVYKISFLGGFMRASISSTNSSVGIVDACGARSRIRGCVHTVLCAWKGKRGD